MIYELLLNNIVIGFYVVLYFPNAFDGSQSYGLWYTILLNLVYVWQIENLQMRSCFI